MRRYWILMALVAAIGLGIYYSRRPKDTSIFAGSAGSEPDPPIFVVQPESWFDIDVSAIPDPTWVMIPPPVRSVSAGAPQPTGFAGAEACAECHREVYDGFVETAHYRTSQACSPSTVLGSVDSGKNTLRTLAKDFSIEMQQRDDLVYQHVVLPGPKQQQIDFPMDLIFGSGKMAQTFAFWAGDQVCQSHVSYFTETDEWVNSPQYKDGTADYSRPIRPRCFECHFTHVQWVPGTFNRYVPSSQIYGVTCERCHGPGKAHVAFRRSNDPPGDAKDPITNPRKLPSERQLDVCNLCHAGTGRPLTPAFSFQSGDVLARHVELDFSHQSVEGGVHTDNQAARLYASKCYIESEAITCTTCHNPHVLQRGELKQLSQNCLKCHEAIHCGFTSRDPDFQVAADCISCHMPQRRDTNTEMTIGTGLRFPLLRDHFIRISEEATEAFLKKYAATP